MCITLNSAVKKATLLVCNLYIRMFIPLIFLLIFDQTMNNAGSTGVLAKRSHDENKMIDQCFAT